MHLPNSTDTIVAISTPPGHGGIGVVRLSGKDSFRIAAELVDTKSVTHPQGWDTGTPQLAVGNHVGASHPHLPLLKLETLPSHSIIHSYIRGQTGRVFLDEVLLSIFKKPNSYTGEDVVEISAHGNPLILQRIVAMAIDAGARLATPGEFTLRAFQSGRIDLVQAEAVADLIAAEGEAARQTACYQLSGKLSNYIESLRSQLIDIAALFEAYTDFPEEEIPEEQKSQLLAKLESISDKLDRLAASYQRGELIRRGIRIPIVGPPNAGKSSLFNAILAEERAIVTEVPGTTRDTISESISIGGIPVRFIDTAGLRETTDVIESMGVERSKREIAGAEMIILVWDATELLSGHDQGLKSVIAEYSDKELLLALNKVDLLTEIQSISISCSVPSKSFQFVSAKELRGIDILIEAVSSKISLAVSSTDDQNILTNDRHFRSISTARDQIKLLQQNLSASKSFELLAFDLRQAIHPLEELLGKVTTEDLLAEIFSRFCIGK